MKTFIIWLLTVLSISGLFLFAIRLTAAVVMARERAQYNKKLASFKKSFPVIRVVDSEPKKEDNGGDLPKFGDF